MKDKDLIKLLKDNPQKYKVEVDNDVVTVIQILTKEQDEDINFDFEYYNFEKFGQDMIVMLFEELGIQAERL